GRPGREALCLILAIDLDIADDMSGRLGVAGHPSSVSAFATVAARRHSATLSRPKCAAISLKSVAFSGRLSPNWGTATFALICEAASLAFVRPGLPRCNSRHPHK